MVDGRTHVVSVRQLKKLGSMAADASETKESSYLAANRWWHDHGKESRGPRQGLPPYHPHESEIAYLDRKRDWARRHGRHEQAEQIERQMANVRGLGPSDSGVLDHDGKIAERIELAKMLGVDVPDNLSLFEARMIFGVEDYWLGLMAQDRNEPQSASTDRATGTWIGEFLGVFRSRHQAGELSASEVSDAQYSLEAFREWIGSSTAIDSINYATMEGWWLRVLQSDESVPTKKKRLRFARAFVK
jgi:hypothetical protein